MNAILSILTALLLFFGNTVSASDEHDHKNEKKDSVASDKHEDHESNDHQHKESEDKHDHSEDEHAHNEEDGDGHGEENSVVGPEKGILEASEENGIKLSPQAEKNFEIQKIKTFGNSTDLPKAAIVTAGIEVNIYRIRNGFYKRIDFETISKHDDKVIIKSKDLKVGDEIAISGLGFLRLAEIAAFGGAPEGHSH